MEPIIIVGTGLAGYTVARELRKLDEETPLLMVSADDGAFYSKPMLSNALAGGKAAADLVNTSVDGMRKQLAAEIRPASRVTAIDPASRRIEVDGQGLRYARLVLAIGADPIRIPLAGDAADRVLSVNDLGDYARFRQALEGRRRVAIMGAGLIGCEFANDLAGAGYAVSLVDPAPLPLGRLLPEAAGAAMREALAGIGVAWHLGTVVESVNRADSKLRLGLANGEVLQADVVLSAIGLRPRTALARDAGIKVDRGIVVDRLLRSSDPNIYALGDCAQVDGLVLPFVMPLMQAARALARTLAGEPTQVAYPAMPVVVKTPALPCVVSPPAAGAEGEWEVNEIENGVRGLFRATDGQLLGFALCGEAVAEKMALTRQLPPWLG